MGPTAPNLQITGNFVESFSKIVGTELNHQVQPQESSMKNILSLLFVILIVAGLAPVYAEEKYS